MVLCWIPHLLHFICQNAVEHVVQLLAIPTKLSLVARTLLLPLTGTWLLCYFPLVSIFPDPKSAVISSLVCSLQNHWQMRLHKKVWFPRVQPHTSQLVVAFWVKDGTGASSAFTSKSWSQQIGRPLNPWNKLLLHSALVTHLWTFQRCQCLAFFFSGTTGNDRQGSESSSVGSSWSTSNRPRSAWTSSWARKTYGKSRQCKRRTYEYMLDTGSRSVSKTSLNMDLGCFQSAAGWNSHKVTLKVYT